MPDNRNRKRPIQVKFFVDEKELAAIFARVGTAVHCLLTPFMGLASKLDFAKIAECSYTCCACYSASSAGGKHGDFLKWGPT